jgi:hypothetical protein
LTNTVVSTIHTGQSPQGMVYVPDAVPTGAGMANLSPIGAAGEAVHVTLVSAGAKTPETTVAVNNQGLIDLLEAAVTGLQPRSSYLLALAGSADGSGRLEPVAAFTTNPAGAAIVVAVGPIRRVVEATDGTPRRYLVIAPMRDGKPGTPVQIQG